MARQLKVFSTPAGFVNAVVAAPSQKAALEAWGIRGNVFASGRASVVTDPELVARALETLGQIVRVAIASEEAILKGRETAAQDRCGLQVEADDISNAPAVPRSLAAARSQRLDRCRGALTARERRKAQELDAWVMSCASL